MLSIHDFIKEDTIISLVPKHLRFSVIAMVMNMLLCLSLGGVLPGCRIEQAHQVARCSRLTWLTFLETLQPERPTLPKISDGIQAHLNHSFSTLIPIPSFLSLLPTLSPALPILQTRILLWFVPLHGARSLPPPRHVPRHAVRLPPPSPGHHQPDATSRRSSLAFTASPAASRRHHDRKGNLAVELYAGPLFSVSS